MYNDISAEELLQKLQEEEKENLRKNSVSELKYLAATKGISSYETMGYDELVEELYNTSLISKASITIEKNNAIVPYSKETDLVPLKSIIKNEDTIKKGEKSRKFMKAVQATALVAVIIFTCLTAKKCANKNAKSYSNFESSQSQRVDEVKRTFYDIHDEEQVKNRANEIRVQLEALEKEKDVLLPYDNDFIEKSLRYFAGTTKDELSLEEGKEMLDMMDAIWNAEDTHAASFYNNTKEAKDEDVTDITELFFYDESRAQKLVRAINDERNGMVRNQNDLETARKHAHNFLELFVNSWIHVSDNSQYNVYELETTGYEMVLDSFILHTAMISGTEKLADVTYQIKDVVIDGEEIVTDVTIKNLIKEANKANCPGKADNGDDILVNKFTSDFIGSIHEANYDLSGQSKSLTK